MKTLRTKCWGAIALTLTALLLPAGAQQASTNAAGIPRDRTLGSPQRANLLLGQEVRTADNQTAGKLDEMILSLEADRILYAVVDTGKGKVAVAPEVFTSGTPNNLRVSVNKAKIDGAPQVTNMKTLKELANAGFVSKVMQYYGQQPWWANANQPLTAMQFGNVHRASKVPGWKVENVNNQTVGKLHNVVVDLPSGRVTYVVLQPDPGLKLAANEFYALPPEAVTWNAGRNTFVTNVTKDKLAAAPHFSQNDWAQLDNPTFASQVYQYYGKQPYFETGGALQPTGR